MTVPVLDICLDADTFCYIGMYRWYSCHHHRSLRRGDRLVDRFSYRIVDRTLRSACRCRSCTYPSPHNLRSTRTEQPEAFRPQTTAESTCSPGDTRPCADTFCCIDTYRSYSYRHHCNQHHHDIHADMLLDRISVRTVRLVSRRR
jgi:hypothetical protein